MEARQYRLLPSPRAQEGRRCVLIVERMCGLCAAIGSHRRCARSFLRNAGPI
jgi:hypothetical protein